MDKQAILKEILQFKQEALQPELQDGDLTYRDIERELGWGHSKTQKVMADLVAQGRFERFDIPSRGGRMAVFRRVPGA